MIGLTQPRVTFDDYTSTINVVSSATVGNWSAWVELDSGSVECDGLILRTSWFGSSSCYNLLEIGIGPPGSEVAVVEGILHHYQIHSTSRGQQQTLAWNVRIPAGARVSIRRRSSASSGNGYLRVGRVRSGRPIGSGTEAYGATTASPFGTAIVSGPANLFGSLVELGTTSKRVRQLCVAVAGTGASGWLAWEIHIGPIGSEVLLLRAHESGTIMGDGFVTPLFFGPFDVDLPEGTRITFRHSCQAASQQLYYAVQGTY